MLNYPQTPPKYFSLNWFSKKKVQQFKILMFSSSPSISGILEEVSRLFICYRSNKSSIILYT